MKRRRSQAMRERGSGAVQVERVGVTRLAKLAGVRLQAMQDAVKRGRVVLGPDGKVEAAEGLRQFEQNADPAKQRGRVEASPDAPEVEGMTLHEARRRAEIVRLRLAELDLARRRSELVDRAEALAEVERAYATVRTRLLALPARMAALVAPDRPAEIRALLAAMVAEALEALTFDLDGPDRDGAA